MNFVDSVKTCLTKFVDFSGRASRSEYWWFILFIFIVMFVAQLINQNLGQLVGLAFFIPSLAVAIRRLHDVNRSGWWYLLVFIPIIGALVLLYWFVQEGTPGLNQFGV